MEHLTAGRHAQGGGATASGEGGDGVTARRVLGEEEGRATGREAAAAGEGGDGGRLLLEALGRGEGNGGGGGLRLGRVGAGEKMAATGEGGRRRRAAVGERSGARDDGCV